MPPRRLGAIVIERTVYLDGRVAMLRQRFTGHDTRSIITHDAAIRSLVEVRRGRLVIPLATGDIVVPARCVLAVPARSVLPLRFEHAEVITDGSGATRPLDDHVVPALEAAPDDATGRSVIAAGGALIARLDADAGVAAPLVRARAALHDAIASPAPVRIAAAQIGVAPETLTRWFAVAYRVTPKRYCHVARLFDAAILLFDGVSVLDAALRAGFNDLTRFYVQFRRLLGGTPGSYARIRNRQAEDSLDR